MPWEPACRSTIDGQLGTFSRSRASGVMFGVTRCFLSAWNRARTHTDTRSRTGTDTDLGRAFVQINGDTTLKAARVVHFFFKE